MRIAHFDCFSGISGDMVLGACVDAGLPLNTLRGEVKKLGLKGYTIAATREARHHVAGTRMRCRVSKNVTQPSRTLKAILRLIESSTLSRRVKTDAAAIFSRLGEAEAAVHNMPVEKIHFHEVGAVDSILDIVGAAVAMEALGIERVTSSALPLGSGTVTISHGTIPVPVPATVRLLKGVPVYESGIEQELVTPTGAAILTHYASDYSGFPAMRIEAVGYGVGSRDPEARPNLLRVVIGEAEDTAQREAMDVIETNVDDMRPEVFGALFERLFEAGALDVYVTALVMKKGRPGHLLTVLCEPWKTAELVPIIFAETSTFGVRTYRTQKYSLERETKTVTTAYGAVKVKIGSLGGKVVSVSPEYESCQKLAKRKRVPLKEIYAAAEAAARDSV